MACGIRSLKVAVYRALTKIRMPYPESKLHSAFVVTIAKKCFPVPSPAIWEYQKPL